MNAELLLPAALVVVPPRAELSFLLEALSEKDRGLLRVDLDATRERDDGYDVSKDDPLYGAGAQRLLGALLMQSQLRVLR
jgi:hypothetical protein